MEARLEGSYIQGVDYYYYFNLNEEIMVFKQAFSHLNQNFEVFKEDNQVIEGDFEVIQYYIEVIEEDINIIVHQNIDYLEDIINFKEFLTLLY